jgi:hypothetical protein
MKTTRAASQAVPWRLPQDIDRWEIDDQAFYAQITTAPPREGARVSVHPSGK